MEQEQNKGESEADLIEEVLEITSPSIEKVTYEVGQLIMREIRFSDTERRYRFLRFFWSFWLAGSVLEFLASIIILIVYAAAGYPGDIWWVVFCLTLVATGILFFVVRHYHGLVLAIVQTRIQANGAGKPAKPKRIVRDKSTSNR